MSHVNLFFFLKKTNVNSLKKKLLYLKKNAYGLMSPWIMGPWIRGLDNPC